MDKLKVLSRSYPQIVAGDISSYHFNPLDASFSMSFVPLSALLSTDPTAARSTIYVNKNIYYPHGLNVAISSSSAAALKNVEDFFAVDCSQIGSGTVDIVQTQAIQDNTSEVSVSISRCGILEDKMTPCMCK